MAAVNSDDDSMTAFSSWGPTQDGRLKPDLAAPGCQVGGDGGTTSTLGTASYDARCGTSMAAPVVTGIGALAVQHYRKVFPGRPDLLPATLKAMA